MFSHVVVAITGEVERERLTRNPIYWSSDLVLVTRLQRVNHPQHLGSVAASRGGIGHDETDLLGGVYDEDRSDGEGHSFFVDIGGVLVVDPGPGVRKVK